MLLAELGAAGWTTWVGPPTLATIHLRAVTTRGETLLAVGHDATDTAWLLVHDLSADASDVTSWQLVSLGEGRHANDLYAADDGVTIVGAEVSAGEEVKPFLWHLPL